MSIYISFKKAIVKYDLSTYLMEKYMEKMQKDKHFVVLLDGKIRFDEEELHRFLTTPHQEKTINFDISKFIK